MAFNIVFFLLTLFQYVIYLSLLVFEKKNAISHGKGSKAFINYDLQRNKMFFVVNNLVYFVIANSSLI